MKMDLHKKRKKTDVLVPYVSKATSDDRQYKKRNAVM